MIRWEVDGYEVAFTTRVGGVSEGPYASLNLGRKSGDEPERADENRRIACEAIGADVEKLALNYQVHSDPRAARGAGDARRARRRALDRRARPADPRHVRRLPADRRRAGGRVRARHRRPPRRLERAARRHRRGGRAGARRRHAGRRDRSRASAPAVTRWGRRSRRPSASASATTSSTTAASTSGRAPSARSAPPESAQVDRFDRCTACEPETFFSHRRDAGRTGRQGVIAYVAG